MSFLAYYIRVDSQWAMGFTVFKPLDNILLMLLILWNISLIHVLCSLILGFVELTFIPATFCSVRVGPDRWSINIILYPVSVLVFTVSLSLYYLRHWMNLPPVSSPSWGNDACISGRVDSRTKDWQLTARYWVISRLTYNHGQYPLRTTAWTVISPFSFHWRYKYKSIKEKKNYVY